MNRQTLSHHRNQESNLRPPKVPDRPLVPYMRFSKKMWPKVRAENPDSPLWDLGKVIGQMWNTAPQTEKSVYQQEYEAEKIEYEKAMKNYNATYAQYMSGKSRVKGTPQNDKPNTSNRKANNDQNTVTGVFIQPVDDEDPFEMAGKRLAAIRYDRNNRLMAELFSSNFVPDPRTFVPQHRIEHIRRQGQSLEQHQNKLNDELTKLDNQFNQRKRAIEEAAEAHANNMKRVCQEKPQLDQEHWEKIADEYEEQLLANWKQFEERQTAYQAKLDAERRANPVLSDLITSKSPPPQDETNAAMSTSTFAAASVDPTMETSMEDITTEGRDALQQQNGENANEVESMKEETTTETQGTATAD